MKKVHNKIKSFALLFGLVFSSLFFFVYTPVYAVPEPSTTENQTPLPSNPSNATPNTPETTPPSDETGNNNTSTTPSLSNPSNATDPNHSNPTDTQTSPDQNTSTDSTQNTENQEPVTCTSQIGAVGHLICPTTGLLAKGIDALYGVIEGILSVKPLDMTDTSPVFQVWSYMRNVANICFIIFLLVIIYSQITGVGFNNYGIKKSLPRLIITAIIVNFSFLICAIAVDISNIIGNGMKDLLAGIAENAIASGTVDPSKNTGFYALFTTIAAGGAGTALILAFPGGPLGLLLALIPVIIGGIISVVVGLLVLGLRQALVVFLVAISPVAFVLYVLPNTEKHFTKWKNTFSQMLFFYPMFSLLFGVTKLAGMIFITSAASAFGIIIGVAIQVLPLFLAANMMKLSGTALSGISNRLNRLGANASSKVGKTFTPLQELNRQKAVENAMKRERVKNLLPWYWGGAMAAQSLKNQSRLTDEKKTRDDTINQYLQEDLDAKRRGARIISRDEYGRATYKQKYLGRDQYGRKQYTDVVDPHSKVMEYTYQNRVAKLATSAQHTRTEDALGNMSDYVDAYGIKNSNLSQLAKNQTENYLNYKTNEASKRINDHNANKFYSEVVRKAATVDQNGKPVDLDAYDKYVVRGAGTDAWHLDDGSLTEQQITNRSMALELVAADAVSVYESERKNNIGKLSTYMDKMVTRDAIRVYQLMLRNKSMDGIIAGNNVLARRGDYDKILSNIRDYMDAGHLQLGSDDANTLALSLMSMKDADPTLGRLGKFINMETWAYTSGKRKTQEVTVQQFYTGKVKGESEYTTKINMATGLKGTKLDKIDRNAADNIVNMIDHYQNLLGPEENQHDAIFDAIRPALVSAISSFPSGSEQIVNVAGMLAGLDRKEWTTGKIQDNIPKITKSEVAHNEIRKYLSALTAKDVAGMKTDMLNAIKHRLIAEHYDFNPADFSEEDRPAAQQAAYEEAEKEAYKEINNIFASTKVLEDLAKPNSHLFDGMKSKLKDIIMPEVQEMRKNKQMTRQKQTDKN